MNHMASEAQSPTHMKTVARFEHLSSQIHDYIDNLDMQKAVIVFFAVSVLAHTLACGYMKHAGTYMDEFIYLRSAYDVARGYGFQSIYGQPYAGGAIYRVLYIALIAPACLIHNMGVRFFAIAFINSVLLNLGIFPIYYLTRQLSHNKLTQFAILIAYVLTPEQNLATSFMTDIVLHPIATTLVCCSLTFVHWYELEKEERRRLVIATLICLPLATLAKQSGSIFVVFILAGLIIGLLNGERSSWRARARALSEEERKWQLLLRGGIALLVCGMLLALYASKDMPLVSALHGYAHRLFNFDRLTDPFFYQAFFYQLLTVTLVLCGLSHLILLFGWPLLGKRERQQLALLIAELLIYLIIVTLYIYRPGVDFYSTALEEPENLPRPIFRYMFFMFMPVFVFAFVTCERLEEQDPDESAVKRLIISAGIYGLVMGLFFYGSPNWSATDTSSLSEWYMFEGSLHSAGTLLLACLLFGSTVLFIKCRRWTLPLFLSVVVALHIWNGSQSWIKYYSLYGAADAQQTILPLRDFVYEHPDDTFLCVDYNTTMLTLDELVSQQYGDTYLDATNVSRVRVASLDQLYGEGGYSRINLNEHPIGADALTEVDYVIISNRFSVGDRYGCRPAGQEDYTYYTLYKCDNSRLFPVLSAQGAD